MVNIEELQSKIIIIKARLFEIAESKKEGAALRDELCNLVGEARGIMQTKAEYEKVNDLKIEEGIKKVLEAQKVAKKRIHKKTKVEVQKSEVTL